MRGGGVLRSGARTCGSACRSICSGVAPISRANWFSVCTFFGIRLSSADLQRADVLPRRAVSGDMTMTPSRRRTSKAGRVAGRRDGHVVLSGVRRRGIYAASPRRSRACAIRSVKPAASVTPATSVGRDGDAPARHRGVARLAVVRAGAHRRSAGRRRGRRRPRAGSAARGTPPRFGFQELRLVVDRLRRAVEAADQFARCASEPFSQTSSMVSASVVITGSAGSSRVDHLADRAAAVADEIGVAVQVIARVR